MIRVERVTSCALIVSALALGACGNTTDGQLFEPTSSGASNATTGGGDGDATSTGGSTEPDPDPSGGPGTTTGMPDPTAGDGTTTGDSGTTGENLCGNGVIDAGEECDGTEFGDATCLDFTDDSGEPFTGGRLSCSYMTCEIVTTACTNFRCGDGMVQMGEECDGPIDSVFDRDCFFSGLGDGEITCSDECTFDTSGCIQCGDGQVGGGEECDGGIGSATCESQGFDYGTLTCGSGCNFDTSGCAMNTCGDGVRLGDEVCDCGPGATDCTPEQVGGETCESAGGGTLNYGAPRCNGSCDALELSNCTQCGNGVREGSEPCDGGDVGGSTCEDAGFLPGVTGSVTCNSDCSFNTANCVGTRCDAANPAPSDGGGSCGADWMDTGAGCQRDCTTDSCMSPVVCPVDRSCDVNCTDSSSCDGRTITCAPDNSCDLSCTAVGACASAVIECPAGADCNVSCNATNGCNGATIQCPSGNFECTVSCEGAGACANVTMECAGGPCRMDCGAGSNACGGATLACGADACEAACTGDSAPSVECGDSCGCVSC